MTTRRFPSLPSLALLLITATGCQKPAPLPSTSASTLAGDWTLIELNANPAPTGAGGRRATLQFGADSGRVAGFAGSNRLSASYTSAGESLHFGPTALTRMACAEGMGLELEFADALAATTRFQISGTELTLLGASGPVARLSRDTP